MRSPQAVCGTPSLPSPRFLWFFFMGLAFALLLLAIAAVAQTMPENASAKSYGDGWQCNVGYRLTNETCAAIVVPDNAYETNRTYGSGWECHHGFRKVDGTACIAVVVPDGGFLDPSGERWHCLRGFFKVDDKCQEIVMPENAYLVDGSRGSSWECERGFKQTGDLCGAIGTSKSPRGCAF